MGGIAKLFSLIAKLRGNRIGYVAKAVLALSGCFPAL
jgi:hypothetical protein